MQVLRAWACRLGGLAIVALLAGGAGPKPPAPSSRVITNPDWLEKPSAGSIASLFPQVALELEVEGRTIVGCKVAANGDLEGCNILYEWPKGLGFGAATLAMTPEFHMRPKTINGDPVAGGTVRIPINFQLPRDRPAAATTDAASGVPSAAALVAARRLVDVYGAVPDVMERYEATVRNLEFLSVPNVSEETRFAAADALRAAAHAHADDYREAYARSFATVYSEAELDGLLAYRNSAAGRVNMGSKVLPLMGELNREYFRRTAAEAHAIYCASHRCDASAEGLRLWRAGDGADGGIDNPQWAEAPDEAALSRAQPPLAHALGLSGAVRLGCRVRIDGRLEQCEVEEEAPAGVGYGGSALTAARHYRLAPALMVAGASGEHVTLRIRFQPVDRGEPLDDGLKARSERALAAARRLLAIDGMRERAQKSIDVDVARLERAAPQGATMSAYAEGVAAYRVGADRALNAYVDQLANMYAALFSEEELEGVAAFRDGPLGKASVRVQAVLTQMSTDTALRLSAQVHADARTAFCRTRDCGSPAPPVNLPPEGAPAGTGSPAPAPRR